MTRDIDIALLRAFISVVETGGMTRAGRLLHLTQAAVSLQIKRLEALLDVELFDRRQKKLPLTPAGDRLLTPARRMLALNDEVWGMMTAPQFDGEVNLGVPHDIVAAFMPTILHAFGQAWPQVRINLHTNTTLHLLDSLATGDIDLTLTTETRPLKGDGMLLADDLVWVGAPEGSAYTRHPLPVAFGDATCAFRASAMSVLREAGRDWRAVCEDSNMGPMQTTLAADMAIAPLLSQAVPDGLEILTEDLGTAPMTTFYINLHVGPSGTSPIATELADHIRRHFAARYPLAA